MNEVIQELQPEDSKSFLSSLKKVLVDVKQLLKKESKQNAGLDELSSLLKLYLRCPSKFQAKRLIASFFQNLDNDYKSFIQEKLCAQLLSPFPSDLTEKEHVKDIRLSVGNINFLLENFQFGEKCLATMTQESVQFLIQAEKYFLSHVGKDVSPVYLNQVMHHCLVTMQTLNLVLQKLVVDKPAMVEGFTGNAKLMAKLIDIDVQIIHNELILLDCRCCCAMNVFLLIQISLPWDKNTDVVSSLLYPINEDETDFDSKFGLLWMAEKKSFFVLNQQSHLSYLTVVFGYIAMMTPHRIRQELGHGRFFYIDQLLPSLLKHGEKCEDTVSKALFGKTINLWTCRLASSLGVDENAEMGEAMVQRLQGSSPAVESLLQYVWTHWEDQLDVMRQSAKTVFENVLKMHVASTRGELPSGSAFISSLLCKLFHVSWTSRGKFSALSSCVLFVGAKCLLDRRADFPTEVLNQFQDRSLACYACDLYMNILSSHRKELSETPRPMEKSSRTNVTNAKELLMDKPNEKIFLQTWIEPVINVLRFSVTEVKNSVVDYLLPRLLKSDRKVLDFMINRLSFSTDQQENSQPCYGSIVACLRRARVMGFLRSPMVKRGEELLYGVLHPDILKSTLFAQEEQVRLDAFAFLCESSKTTEAVTAAEFEMLQLFIATNLNSQSPAYRQSFLALLKKFFTRMKESLQPLKRIAKKNNCDTSECIRSYIAFLEWITNLMIVNLHPGAAFARRITCLSSLSLMNLLFNKEDDGFSVSTFMNESHIRCLMNILADTFEENNVESLKILTNFTFLTGRVTTCERMKSLLQMSLSLACSTRPQDCGTAAYIMLLLLNQKDIFSLLKTHQIDLKTNTAKEMLSRINEMFATPPFSYGDQHSKASNQAYVAVYLLHILVVFLQDQTEVAGQSLITAAANRPMYPTLQCIRYIMQQLDWKSFPVSIRHLGRHFLQLLIQTCLDLSKVVSPVVQNSSPEGNVPADAILGPGLQLADLLSLNINTDQMSKLPESVVSSQMLVEAMPEYLIVCCWRSIKEVSLTLGKMCLQIPVSAIVAEESVEEKQAVLTLVNIKTVGEYFTEQLLGSIHRGAFELAYAGFQLMCQMLWSHPHPDFHSLPTQWLVQIITDIKSQDPNSKLCATRRSAGVPFFIQAITSSEPLLTGRQCFHSAMKELIVFALDECDNTEDKKKENKDAQVHALNILRALYNDSRLREDVGPYIADGVKAAIRGFKSNLWSVRNSATLLLSTLMTRMFGVKRSKDETAISKKNCQTGRSFFYHYPSLYPFLLSELEEATTSIGPSNTIKLHPSLYPILLVLGRLFPSMLEGSDTSLSLSAFIPYILRCASSHILKTRIIAARALQPLARRNQIVQIAKTLFVNMPQSSQLDGNVSSSHIHGSLLQLCELVKLVRDFNTAMQESILPFLVSEMLSHVWLLSAENKCFATRQAALLLVDYILDVARLVRSLPVAEAEFVLKLKSSLITLLSVVTSAEDRWKPLVYEYEKTRAMLTLKHLSELESGDHCLLQKTETTHSSNEATTSSRYHEKVVLSFLQSTFYEVRLQVLCMFFSALTKQSVSPEKSGRGENGEDRRTVVDSSDSVDITGHTLVENVVACPDTGMRNLLQNMASDIMEQILHIAIEVEEHHECVEKIFHILVHIPNITDLLKKMDVSSFTKIFGNMLIKLKRERRNEVKAAMLRFTGCFIPTLYDSFHSENAVEVLELFTRWTNLLQDCCQIEEFPDILISAGHILLGNTKTLLCDRDQRIGLLSLHFWNVLAVLLQEDDLEVQDIAALAVAVTNGLSEGSLHPNLALEKLPEILLLVHKDKMISDLTRFLVSWIVQDAIVDIKEPNERLFDKSETNTYKDYIAFTRCVTKVLIELFHGKDSSIETQEASESIDLLHPRCLKESQDSDLVNFLIHTFDKTEHELCLLQEHCQPSDAFLNPIRHVSLCHGIFRAKSLISIFKDVYKNENTIQLKISNLQANVLQLTELMDVSDTFL